MNRTRPGFTLIELMVVIAIGLVLAGMVWSVGERGMARARQAESASNLRQLAAANAAYVSDYQTYAPATSADNLMRWHGRRSARGDRFDPTEGYLAPYLGRSRRISVCPEFVRLVDDPSSWEEGSGGYGYNAVYLGGLPTDAFRPASPAQVSNPARTLMFATTALAKASGLQEYPFAEPRQWVDPNGNPGGPLQPSVHFRFHGKALVAWCDGSVSAVPMREASELNYYGGSNEAADIGFPGPARNNGWWNPDF